MKYLVYSNNIDDENYLKLSEMKNYLDSLSLLQYNHKFLNYLRGYNIYTDLDLSNAASNTFYPHMKVNDDNYDNGGANANGDIRDRGLTFTETTIVHNGKKYWLHKSYSMPVLTITNA